MPSLPGSKRPLYSHASIVCAEKKWGWDDMDNFVLRSSSQQQPYDIGILLSELCVVDVDSKQLCTDLEARFPVLGQVPCESTAKGRHYFFRRSAKADELGYYDGRAQVVQGIDFKSVCKSGTSGFIITSPSQGKVWLRAPWDCELLPPAIPDDLLVAVARAQRHAVSASLCFPDGSRLCIHNSTWLPRFSYLEPFFGDLEPIRVIAIVRADDEIPVGVGSASTMQELLWMCDHQRLRTWPADLPGLRQMADYLGAPGAVQAMLSTWHPSAVCARAEALARVNPVWAQVSVGQQKLLDVVQHTGLLTFDPSLQQRRDQQWLFEGRDAATPEFAQMLRPDPLEFAEQSLPAPVLHLLRTHKNLLLAGGAALSVASDCVDAASDYDLFLWGATQDEAEVVRQALLQAPGVSAATQTGAAISVVWGERDEVIQLITWLYSSPEHVLDSFDLAPCKVALGCFGDPEGMLQLRARAAWLESMRHMTCWVDLGHWSDASVARILKYYAKGFDVVIPGLNRRAFRVRDPINFPLQRGISNLFKVEALTDRRLRGVQRPTYEDLHTQLRGYCHGVYKESAYAETFPSTLLAHVVRAIVASGMTWLGLGQPRHRSSKHKKQQQQAWTPAPATGSLFPASPRCSAAFKYSVLRGGEDSAA